MASIYRVESGLIFDDDFDTLDSRWSVSPSHQSSVYDAENGLLTLQHSDNGYTSALFELPQEEDELLFEVQASYFPQEVGDEGGLVIWKSALEKLEFFESLDNSQEGDYSYWRVTKRNNLWSFFAYKNGAWELFDSSVCINPVLAGVALSNPPRVGYVDLGIRRAFLCRGKHVTVGNVSSGYKLQLLDEGNAIINEQVVPEHHAGATMELPWIPFKGKIRIVDMAAGGVTLVDSDVVEMYGGDVFMSGTDLTVFWKGMELDAYNPTRLGAMKNNNLLEKMTLANTTSGNVAEDIVIRVAIFRESWGWEWVDIANDVNGEPGNMADSIQMGNLQAGETRDFWVHITRGEQFSTKPVYFLLDIRNY